MIIPSLEELDSLKYSDLQNLAKSLGLRANLRATKLLKALKGYIKHEARKGNENQDESQTSASSCDETEIQISNQEEAERQPLGHVTKTRRRCKTVRVDPDSQNHEKQESQDLRATAKVPSPPDEHQEAENAVSSGKRGINGNRDSKVPSEGKKSLYTDESSKPGKNKRTAITTPNFKKLHEAHFKEMESIDQYIERKKKHFEEHNSMNELKQPINKGGVRTPVPPRGRLSVASTPISQRRSQGRSCGPASQSTLGLKGSLKRSAISAAKTGVRFSAATKDNEHKRSLTKTPARKSAHVTVSGGTPKGEAVLGTHKLKTITGNSAAGKLKPWGQSKENNYLNQHVNRINFYKKTYKQPHLQTKEEQRKKREQERKEKKAKVLGMRRGLILAED
ncbi:nucleolar and spindle-associated protein 1 isoform X15 [Homo sapiens]|uniref:nucleolar and spindle-associated protein 1 isoform X15 n=1 Tax=Homo sapiens TaxID=9606 RepID=UPI001FB156DD|nr:nucleolar and spindle-associated protein 1 isoform X15 [Homo sapiens]XP_054234133.1 nucleolar and spindle-associated protein 1 isoform X15 [Homo sapiens]